MRVQIYDVHNVVLRASEQVSHGKLRGRSFLRTTFENVQASLDLHIFIADGAGARKMRQAVYSGYKAKRPPMTEDRRAGIELFKTVLTLSKALSITCEGWEADDVIATVAKQMALSEGVKEVVVHTNDSDFGQMADFPGIVFPSIKLCAPPVYVPLFKTLCGDSTDDIPGLPGFGEASFNLMQAEWPLLEQSLREQNHAMFASAQWPRAANLVVRPEVFEAMLAFYDIVHLKKVPDDIVEAGTIVGLNNPAAAEQLFQEFLL